MSLNLANAQLIIAPEAWSIGNGLTDRNTGNFPTYPSGVLQNAVITNCAPGYGYSSDGYFNLDSANDHILFNRYPACLDASASFSFETWVNIDVLDHSNYLFYLYNSSLDHVYFRSTTTGTGRLECRLSNGASSYGYFQYADAGVPSSTWIHLATVYTGSGVANPDKLKIYYNGIEQTLSWNGTVPATTSNFIVHDLLLGHSSTTLGGKIAWWAFYGDSDQTRPAAHYALGKAMGGLIGTNTGNTMALTMTPVTCWAFFAKYKNSNRMFSLNGLNDAPNIFRIPKNVDLNTAIIIEHGKKVNLSKFKFQ